MMLLLVKRFSLLLGVWLVVTSGDPGALAVGVFTAATAVAVSLRLLPPGPRAVRLWNVATLLPLFLADSLRGGVDVALRAFHPRVPVRPGWIAYPLRLPAGLARVSLGNFLSLMPGSLAAGEHHDVLYVHCLDTSGTIEPKIAREEGRIARITGLELGGADV
jgi:multicomponent Na+:H+ antiporter subunit E